MQPWMIIAGLMGMGVLTLLVAPRIHRRSTQRAREAAIAHRAERAEELRRSSSSVEYHVPSLEHGHQAQDALLLRGVRTAVVDDSGRAIVVADERDDAIVGDVLAELGVTDPGETGER